MFSFLPNKRMIDRTIHNIQSRIFQEMTGQKNISLLQKMNWLYISWDWENIQERNLNLHNSKERNLQAFEGIENMVVQFWEPLMLLCTLLKHQWDSN